MKKHYFITGTDTGVGKTLVTAALMVAMQSRGIRCIPVKPIQCGSRDGLDDVDWCLSFSAFPFTHDDRKDMNPYRFDLPASPHLAAQHEKINISSLRIRESIEQIATRYDVLVIEGAGGLLVPINRKESMIDLITLIDSSPIVVTRSGLGTLNHTALTLRELDRAGLTPAAIVVNETVEAISDSDILIRNDNITQIRRMAAPVPVVVFRYQSESTKDALLEAGTALADVLSNNTTL